MRRSMLRAKRYLISLILSLLTACANQANKEMLLPQTGATMQEIYGHAMYGNASLESKLVLRRIREAATDLQGYTRESFNETKQLFERLPNPDLVMYIFPHLAGSESSPVPGYSTTFPLYESVQYALPGEVEAP